MLKRDIRKWDLVLLLINGIIGAGIFGLPSKVFALSGIYSILAFLVCAIIVLVVVLNFAEVASRFDQTGGPYLYTLTAFGPLPAYIVGWILFRYYPGNKFSVSFSSIAANIVYLLIILCVL